VNVLFRSCVRFSPSRISLQNGLGLHHLPLPHKIVLNIYIKYMLCYVPIIKCAVSTKQLEVTVTLCTWYVYVLLHQSGLEDTTDGLLPAAGSVGDGVVLNRALTTVGWFVFVSNVCKPETSVNEMVIRYACIPHDGCQRWLGRSILHRRSLEFFTVLQKMVKTGSQQVGCT